MSAGRSATRAATGFSSASGSAKTDFLYCNELQSMSHDGHLTRLDTAFSRDQAHKIYVQDRLIEHGAELWSWLARRRTDLRLRRRLAYGQGRRRGAAHCDRKARQHEPRCGERLCLATPRRPPLPPRRVLNAPRGEGPHLALPLHEAAMETDSADLVRMTLLAGRRFGAAGGVADPRAPARRGRAVPLPFRHDQVHRLPVVRGSVQRAERQPRRHQVATCRRVGRRRLPRHAAHLSLHGLQSLPGCRLPEGLPRGRVHEGPGHRDRAAFGGRLHWLPVLRLELPVQCAAVQPGARGGREVRHVPRPSGRRPRARLRQRMPGRRDRDRDRQQERVARGLRAGRVARHAAGRSDRFDHAYHAAGRLKLMAGARGQRRNPHGARASFAHHYDHHHAGDVRHDGGAGARQSAGYCEPDDAAGFDGDCAQRVGLSPGPPGVCVARGKDVASLLVEPRSRLLRTVFWVDRPVRPYGLGRPVPCRVRRRASAAARACGNRLWPLRHSRERVYLPCPRASRVEHAAHIRSTSCFPPG